MRLPLLFLLVLASSSLGPFAPPVSASERTASVVGLSCLTHGKAAPVCAARRSSGKIWKRSGSGSGA